MKKLFGLLAAICLFATMPAAAQFNFGVKAGVNLPQKPTTNIEELKSSLKGNTGWFVGPTAKFIFPVVGLGVEANVLYSQNNLEIEGQNVTAQNIDIPVYLRYELSLPVINKYIEPFIPSMKTSPSDETVTTACTGLSKSSEWLESLNFAISSGGYALCSTFTQSLVVLLRSKTAIFPLKVRLLRW